jgi:hypothetical protein
MADFQKSLETIRGLLNDRSAFQDGKPQFKSVMELDQTLRSRGFRLGDNQPFGPQALGDARQLIYEGPNNVIVKVKTRGYAMGPRANRPTLSIEATDGKGGGWDNVLFKADGNGKIIAKNLINEDELARLPNGQWGVKRGSTGKVEPFSKFEVIQGGQSKPFDKQAWADRGHLDLPREFSPTGADKLRPPPPPGGGPPGGGPPGGGGGAPGGNEPPGGGAKPGGSSGGAPGGGKPGAGPSGTLAEGEAPPAGPKAVPRVGGGRLRAVGKAVGTSVALLGVSILLNYLRGKVEQNLIEKQMRDLEPEILRRLAALKVRAATLLAAGAKAFANVSVDVWSIETVEAEPGGVMRFQTLPVVSLVDVGVSDHEVEGPGPVRRERQMVQTVIHQPYSYSFEVALSPAEVEEFRRLKADLDWYEQSLQDPFLAAEDRARLNGDKMVLEGKIHRWAESD